MKQIIIILTIIALSSFCSLSAFENLDTDYMLAKRNSPEFRLGLTGGPLLNLGDEDVSDAYEGFLGFFIDWNIIKERNTHHRGYDIFLRGSYRNFQSEADADSGVLWDGTMDIGSFGTGFRYNYGIKAGSNLLQLFLSAHGEVVYVREYSSDRDEQRDFLSLGIVGGAGVDLAPSPDYSFFAEYNYGYAPVGVNDSNIEGHQFWFGACYRTR